MENIREIKFRAWWGGRTSPYFPHMIDWNELCSEHIPYGFFPRPKKEELVLMQYTGLKDKNGKEIWEGDILRAILNSTETIECVGFEKGAFTISEYKDRHWFVPLTQYSEVMDIFEVMGNIYEDEGLAALLKDNT